MSIVRVMCSLAAHKRHPTRTAYSDGGVVVGERGSFCHEMLLQGGHIVQRVVMVVLIISEDENDVGPACRSFCIGCRGHHKACDAGFQHLHDEHRWAAKGNTEDHASSNRCKLPELMAPDGQSRISRARGLFYICTIMDRRRCSGEETVTRSTMSDNPHWQQRASSGHLAPGEYYSAIMTRHPRLASR